MDIVTYLQQQLLPEEHPAPVPALPNLQEVHTTLFVMRRLIEHCDILQAWHDWAVEIREYFPTAVSARIDRESEYDDEGGYYYTVGNVRVFDHNGTRLDGTLDEETEDLWRDWQCDMGAPPEALCGDTFSLHELPRWPFPKKVALIAVDMLRTWLQDEVPSTMFQSPLESPA